MTELLEPAATIHIRRGERFDVSIMSQLTLADGSHIDALVCNLSARGFMINTSQYIAADTLLRVELPGIGSRPAKTVWSFCGDTGAEFLQPVDLDRYWDATAPAEPEPTEEPVLPSDHLGKLIERGAERFIVNGRLSVRTADFRTIEVQVCDISRFGIKATCPTPLPIGSIATIHVPGIGERQAEVKWSFGGHFGAMFLSALDLKKCDWSTDDLGE